MSLRPMVRGPQRLTGPADYSPQRINRLNLSLNLAWRKGFLRPPALGLSFRLFEPVNHVHDGVRGGVLIDGDAQRLMVDLVPNMDPSAQRLRAPSHDVGPVHQSVGWAIGSPGRRKRLPDIRVPTGLLEGGSHALRDDGVRDARTAVGGGQDKAVPHHRQGLLQPTVNRGQEVSCPGRDQGEGYPTDLAFPPLHDFTG